MKNEILRDSGAAYRDLQPEYQRTLVSPLDDMWATFADQATPYAMLVDGKVAGCCSVDENNDLHHFYLRSGHRDHKESMFAQTVEQLEIRAAFPGTVDPFFLSLSLARGDASEPVALMYQQAHGAADLAELDMRIGTVADHEAAIAFDESATDAPRNFLEPFLGTLIEAGDLLLHESGGQIIAKGECRVDRRAPGHSQLGVVVAVEHRNQGLGARVMAQLTRESQSRNLVPLCSTEPQNMAAQRAVERAGFESRHQVLRVSMS